MLLSLQYTVIVACETTRNIIFQKVHLVFLRVSEGAFVPSWRPPTSIHVTMLLSVYYTVIIACETTRNIIFKGAHLVFLRVSERAFVPSWRPPKEFTSSCYCFDTPR